MNEYVGNVLNDDLVHVIEVMFILLVCYRITFLHREVKELQERNKILSTENYQMCSEFTTLKEQVNSFIEICLCMFS